MEEPNEPQQVSGDPVADPVAEIAMIRSRLDAEVKMFLAQLASDEDIVILRFRGRTTTDSGLQIIGDVAHEQFGMLVRHGDGARMERPYNRLLAAMSSIIKSHELSRKGIKRGVVSAPTLLDVHCGQMMQIARRIRELEQLAAAQKQPAEQTITPLKPGETNGAQTREP